MHPVTYLNIWRESVAGITGFTKERLTHQINSCKTQALKYPHCSSGQLLAACTVDQFYQI
jgi:hypothetical protein